VRLAPGRLDGQIDGGVRGGLDEQELRRPREQDRPHALGRHGQRLRQEGIEHQLQLAQPAQHSRRQQPREGAVARLDLRRLGPRQGLGQQLVERPPIDQHARDQLMRQAACRQAWRGRPRRRCVLA
jgi:hypothetical protein